MTTKCPQCFQPLPSERYAWTCSNGGCPTEPDPVASAYFGGQLDGRWRAEVSKPADGGRRWAPPADVSCLRCHSPAREICPLCHFVLPPRWRSGQATCIAMAGARATGKSVYIGVTYGQLELLAMMMGTTFTPADEKTATSIRDNYLKPLYQERGTIGSTPSAKTSGSPQRDPLIFTIGNVGGVQRYLVIRDVAGEDLETGTVDVTHLAFFRHADAVLFMFDPLRIGVIHDLLRNKIPRQLQSGGDPVAVLTKLRQVIGPARPRLGVVVSKFDAMEELASVDNPGWQRVMSHTGAAVRRDPSLSSVAYNSTDGDLLHQEVRSLMFKLKADPMVLLLENPNDGNRIPFRFFAVSALGESTNGENLHGRGIASFRCLDPVKWVLSDLGVLPTAT